MSKELQNHPGGEVFLSIDKYHSRVPSSAHARWSEAGAEMIFDLRLCYLSGIWDQVYQQGVNSNTESPVRTPDATITKKQRRVA